MAAANYKPRDQVVQVFLNEDADEMVYTAVDTTDAMAKFRNDVDAADDDSDGDRDVEGSGKRHSWTKKREYILTLLGYIVGIGNIWRFPYMCQRNGGGAFLLPFVLCLAVVGFPLFFLETALGQFTGKSPLHVWSVCPLLKGVGISVCITSMIAFWYFNTIMSWAVYYLVSSFQAVVPWSLCDQWWNTPQCTNYSDKYPSFADVNDTITSSDINITALFNVTGDVNNASSYAFASSDGQVLNGNGTGLVNLKVVAAAEEFWQHNVLQVSGSLYEPGHIVWYLALAQCFVILFIFLALVKGIKSSGKVVYVTATAPYILLTVLLIRGATLPGAKEGILFYLTPDFYRLLEPKVWVEAALQVFYSLGPGWGGLIATASYNNFDNNCLRDALMLSFMGEGTSVFGGLAIFSVLGYMAHQTGVSVEKVVSTGPGLVFIGYPEAIAMMPLPQLWAVLFFIMIFTVVVDSQLMLGETVLTVLCDSFPHTLRRRRVLITGIMMLTAFLASLCFITQGGIYVFQLVDWFFTIITVATVVLIESVVISWVYGADRFGADIQLMIGRQPPLIMKILWAFVTPIGMLVLLAFTLMRYETPSYGDYHYDSMGTTFGWLIALVSFIPLPFVAIHQLYKASGTLAQRIRQTTRPDEHWGPADPSTRMEYRKQMMQRPPRRHWLDIFR